MSKGTVPKDKVGLMALESPTNGTEVPIVEFKQPKRVGSVSEGIGVFESGPSTLVLLKPSKVKETVLAR